MRRLRFATFVFVMVLLAACTAETPTPTPEPQTGLPNPASLFCEERGYALVMREESGGTVGYCLFPDGSECEEWSFFRGECAPGGTVWGSEQLEVVLLESFPVQVQAHVRGTLPDTCTAIDRVEQAYSAETRTFSLLLVTKTLAATGCRSELTPFTTVTDLDVMGLARGDYRVELGDLTASFTLAADNALPTPADEGTLPTDLAGWPMLTLPTFGFSLRYPPDWQVTETTDPGHTLAGHQIQIAPPGGGDIVFSVAYKRSDDAMRITRSGLREGELISHGTIDFLGVPVDKTRLEFEGKVMGVYYDGAGEVQRAPVTFTLALDFLGDSRTGGGISAETEHLADLIVTSFTLEGAQ